MALIHHPILNYSLRTLLYPFRRLIPENFYFAINGTIKIDLGKKKHLIFHGNPTSGLVRMLFWKGIKGFEYNAYKIFIELVKDSKLFFDIGANLGYYSLVAKKFNPRIKVIAFEPLPAAYKYFLKNIALNSYSDIHVEMTALSNEKGTAQFYTYKNMKFGNLSDQLVGDGSLNASVNKSKSIAQYEVRTDILDNYIKQHLEPEQKIDLIKIDTEATEHLIFEGAENVLRSHRPIIMCEIIKNETENKLPPIFSRHSYDYYKVLPEGLMQVDKFIIDQGKDDYFLVPREKKYLVQKFFVP